MSCDSVGLICKLEFPNHPNQHNFIIIQLALLRPLLLVVVVGVETNHLRDYAPDLEKYEAVQCIFFSVCEDRN